MNERTLAIIALVVAGVAFLQSTGTCKLFGSNDSDSDSGSGSGTNP